MSSSSSDSEDDEEKMKLAQAVDPSWSGNNGKIKGGHTAASNGEPDASSLPKSKRPKIDDEMIELSEFSKPYSLDVTPDGQKFIAKQLATALEKYIKEISPPRHTDSSTMDADTLGIKLFASSTVIVTENDLKSNGTSSVKPRPSKSKKKRKRKRKSKAKDASSSSSESSESEEERLKSVAVSADWILQNN